MAHAADAAHAEHHDHVPTFWRRWFLSTNHKDIGTLYFLFGFMAGIVGGAFSIAMRMELQEPGLQFFSNPQAFNVIVTGHGLVMVFFMVPPRWPRDSSGAEAKAEPHRNAAARFLSHSRVQPVHFSSVTSGQPAAGAPIAVNISLLPGSVSNRKIALSVDGLMN